MWRIGWVGAFSWWKMISGGKSGFPNKSYSNTVVLQLAKLPCGLVHCLNGRWFDLLPFKSDPKFFCSSSSWKWFACLFYLFFRNWKNSVCTKVNIIPGNFSVQNHQLLTILCFITAVKWSIKVINWYMKSNEFQLKRSTHCWEMWRPHCPKPFYTKFFMPNIPK